MNIAEGCHDSHRLCRCETRQSLQGWIEAGHGDLDGSWGNSQRKQRVQIVSAADGAAAVFLSRRQEPEIALGSASGRDPCHSLDDVAAGWLWSEEVGGIFGYAVVGAVAECPFDDSIPGSATVVITGSFTEGVGDPVGWLIGDGRELVAVPVADLAFQISEFDEGFLRNIIRPRRQSPSVGHRQIVFHFGESLLKLFVGERPRSSSGVEGGGFCCGAAEGGDQRGDSVGVLVGEVGALVVVVVEFGLGEVDGVRFSASAHGDVDPFAVNAVTCDGVGPAGGGSLGFVSG
jgi:hypothetical protein